jgi:hypothetical protein
MAMSATGAARPRPRAADDAKAVVLLAVLGALLLGYGAYRNAFVPGVHPANVVHPGAQGPSAAAILEDFPDDPLPPGLGHDGQQFYAIARDPLHPEQVAEHLDRPRYRLQRIAYPLTAWALHPTGGGEGLVLAVFATGVLAVLAGCLATGHLSRALGGGPLPTLAFVLAPGAWFALRFSMADSYALAAALAALAFSLRGRHRWAVAAAVLAVLAKESLILLPFGLLLYHRDRARLLLVAVPGAVAAAWWVALRLLVTDHSAGVIEFTYPFGGLVSAVRLGRRLGADRHGRHGGHRAVRRAGAGPRPVPPPARPGHRGATGVPDRARPQRARPDANGTRMTMPLLVLAVVRRHQPRRRRGGRGRGARDDAAGGRIGRGLNRPRLIRPATCQTGAATDGATQADAG